MKLITLNQLVSSLETTKEYIDKAVGNISAGSNIDTNNLVVTNSISMGREEGSTIGVRSVAVGSNVTASGDYSHAEGFYTEANNNYSHAEGESTTASGHASHAEGNITEASGDYSHAEGFETIASGDYSHAEGESTTASGISSHAEGNSTTASEYCSHAEGGSTTASGYYSHAEGSRTEASNYYSHAEGANTIASGECSHAEGYLTIASSEYQHVQGKYNIEDTANTYAHIVGNGDENARSNAHTLDWNGNAWFAGNVKVGADNKELATTDHTHTKAEIENELTGLVGSHHHDWSTTKGTNTISSTSNDTTSSWGAQGHSIHWYTQTGLLNDQPNQWGYILNLGNGTEVHQMWFTQASGSLYHRGGNASGWSGSWRTILDSSNYETYVPKSSLANYSNTYAYAEGTVTYVTQRVDFVDGTTDEYSQTSGIATINSTETTGHAMYTWGHWINGDPIVGFNLGKSDQPWANVYAYHGVTTGSDRNSKENISYIRNNEAVSTYSVRSTDTQEGITYSDLYDFVKDDLELATFNFKNTDEQKLGFIAQDLLYNIDGTDNKVGQFIVTPTVALTEEEIESKKEEFKKIRNREAFDEEVEALSTPRLQFDHGVYISVLAGALKETIKQVEELKEIVNQQQELINQLLNN